MTSPVAAAKPQHPSRAALSARVSGQDLCDIDTVEGLSDRAFYEDYLRRNRPVRMRGMMGQWRAMQNWSLEYFRELAGDADVHLEEGNVMQQSTEFRKQGFREYLEELIAEPDDDAPNRAYLSLFKIFDEFPQLRGDVDFSILNRHKLKPSTVGWIGPRGTVTGYHIDWGDNILAQVRGRKLLHLAAPDETPNMYPSKKFDQGTTMSEVDLEDYDEGRHPRFAGIEHKRVVLHPGEMLFIPRGWWHHVRSLDKSISVSNLAYDLRGILVDALPHRIKQLLHDAGLWPCECTCHVVRDGRRQRK